MTKNTTFIGRSRRIPSLPTSTLPSHETNKDSGPMVLETRNPRWTPCLSCQGPASQGRGGEYVANPIPRSKHEDAMEIALAKELEREGMTGTEFTQQFATDEIVPTALLESGQTIVKVDSVKHFVKHSSEAHYSLKPLVVQFGGRYIVRDGNHRLAADLLNGKESVNPIGLL